MVVGLRCKDKKSNCASLAASGQCQKSGPTLRDCLITCKAKCDKSPPKLKGLYGRTFIFCICFISESQLTL